MNRDVNKKERNHEDIPGRECSRQREKQVQTLRLKLKSSRQIDTKYVTILTHDDTKRI